MPRIDPLQLLKCLSVLLSPSGGIKSKDEVQRLATLMTKFSKKLVSKCIYVQILKTTDRELLGMFMSAGGWNLIHTWLSDAIIADNSPLIQELLELLLLCPVDVERLKINNCPKLIKGLSKDGSSFDVRILATKLVEQWLKVVKGGNPAQIVTGAEPGRSLDSNASGPNTNVDVSLPGSNRNGDVNLPISNKNVDDNLPGPSKSTKSNLSEPNTSKCLNALDLKPVEDSAATLVPIVKSDETIKEPEVKEETKPEEELKVTEEIKVKAESSDVELKEKNDTAGKMLLVQEETACKLLLEERVGGKESVDVPLATDEVQVDEVATSEDSGEEAGAWNGPVGQLPVYKITIRDGKQVLAKVCSGERSSKKSTVDSSTSNSVDASKTSSEKGNACVSPSKASDSIIESEASNKSNSDLKSSEVKISVSTKAKLEKQDSVEIAKATKDTQKKGKDIHSGSKTSDKKSRNIDSHRDKTKENLKEKLKDKSKDKHKEKEKEHSKPKEKKLTLILDKAQIEKDKATLAKLIPPTISKLGKIPKVKKGEENVKTLEVKNTVLEIKKPPEMKKPVPAVPIVESKKSSISIEVRRNDGVRPKTVKKFHSKFRSTGLEEEVKPPPSRPIKKVPPLPEKKPIKFSTLKRPSPPRDVPVPEKKLKPSISEIVPEEAKKSEKNGSIKLIPPRPKPSFLQESDMFMDALTASSKKEPRKRKRRLSTSKDGTDSKKEGGNKEDSTPPSSPTGEEIKSPPMIKPTLKFYQDTMETEEEREGEEDLRESDKEDMEIPDIKYENEKADTSAAEDEEDDKDFKDTAELDEKRRRLSKDDIPGSSTVGSPQKEIPDDKTVKTEGGVLIYHRVRKGPKKTVRWKPEKELEVVKYFELDETERVNVTKTFLDMKQIERSNEREAFMLARKLPQDDNMEEKTHWLPLIPIDLPPSLAEPGKGSREKDIQYAREKATLQALYFNRAMIPESPAEPDMEIHATTDPTPIPLDDVTGNPDSVNDFQNTPWPEPKPIIIPQSPPQQFPMSQQPHFPSFASQSFNAPQMYPNQPVMTNNMPGPVNMLHPNTMNSGNNGDWRTGDGKVIPLNDLPGPMDLFNQAMPPMNANMGMQMNMNMNMGMNMGIPSNMPSGMPPDMNYNMMGGEDMNPFPTQGFQMGGPPNPNMFNYRGGRGPGMGMGNAGPIRGGRGNRGGPWFRPMGGGGGNWQGGGRGGRGGNWGGPSRTVCKHFRSGFCRQAEKCPYLHPGVNGPQY